MIPALDTGPHSRSRALDAFRGVAIIQVLIWHTFLPLIVTRVPLLDGAMSITWSGVDLFFVLSGYLIGSILMKNRESKGYSERSMPAESSASRRCTLSCS